MQYNINDYEPVEERIKRYADKYPDYRITTELVKSTDDVLTVVIKAYLYKNPEDQEKGCPHATGIAEETKGGLAVNRTSHVENCETSAIGRALANANYSGSKRPSREEMEKVERHTPQTTTAAKSPDLKPCPIHPTFQMTKKSWGGYSHQLSDKTWCNGEGGNQ